MYQQLGICFNRLTPVVTLCTARFNFQRFYAQTVYLCVLCGSENKQHLFTHTALAGWLV